MLRHLIDLCVHRRLAVLGVSLAVAAWGISAYLNTPIEAYPDVTNIQVNVIAQAPGLAPEEVERQVTIPLERVLNGTPGMLLLRSESMFGLSLIWLVFEDDADGFKARTLVAERVASAELSGGVVARLAADYTPLGEIYQYRMVSDRHTLTEMRSEQEWTVTRFLRQVPGVADVVSFGGYLKEFHVQVDPARLVAHELTLADVTAALEKSNQNVGGGFLRNGDQELVIRGVGYLTNPREIQDVVLRSEGGTPVTVGDVARVVISHTPRRGDVGHNLKPEIVEGFVLLRRGENPSTVLDGVHQKVAELNARILPKGMRMEPFYDRSALVGLTLSTVHHNLLFGGLLVVAVVWIFLRSLRSSLIVASVIPLAILTAFIGLRFLRLPANLISMGAIDFGILVDGAVVLAENVIREASIKRIEHRRDMLALVARAAFDVSRPIFYAMAIIIAALIPVFTLERVEGRIFRPLAMTYSFALAGALVFALTTVPAMCALFLRPRDAHHGGGHAADAPPGRYARVLTGLLRRRAVILGGLAALLGVGVLVASHLGSEFLPELDEGSLLVFVEMPTSISLESGRDLLVEVRKRLLAFPEVTEILSEHGRPEDGTDEDTPNLSETFVALAPHDRWRPGWDTDRLTRAMRVSLSEIPGVRYNFSQPIRDNVEESVSGVRGKFVLKVFGRDLEVMRDVLQRAVRTLGKVKGIVDLDIYRDASAPQLQIRLDRAALARAGISVADAQTVIETALGGKITTELWEGERPVPIRAWLPQSERNDPARIGAILVPAPGGSRIPLADLAHIEIASGRLSIYREANSRFVALKFNVEGRDVGSMMKEAMAVVEKDVKLPEGYYFAWAGEFENQQRAMARLSVIVPLSVLVVFALLYMALQSARSALTVLVSAPFAMTGGIFALHFWDIPLSVSAAVGFIALLGQVTLQSLLVISAVDANRYAGGELSQAIVNGATSRARAVVMTALLAMIGLMPMALSHEVGSETQRPFAVVIIGGLATALMVTLFALPGLYSLIARRQLPDTEAGATP